MSQQGSLSIQETPAPNVETLTGDTGGAVPPDGVFNINILGGPNIDVDGTPGSNTLIISATVPGGFTWNDITSSTQNLLNNNGYIANNAGGVTFTLPNTAVVGDEFRVTGIQGSWIVTQNAGQIMHFGNQTTSIGTPGKLAATNARDSIFFICVVTDTEFQVISSIGNITIA